jgi:hypothetical protein
LYYDIGNKLSIRLMRSRVSTWNTAGRPTGKTGEIGYNTEEDQLEVYDGAGWKKVALTGV